MTVGKLQNARERLKLYQKKGTKAMIQLKRKFEGIIVANLTPYGEDGKLDEAAYRAHIEFMIERGVHGLFPIGTMGEGINIPLEEKKHIVDVLVDQNKDRIDLIVQGTCVNTEQTIEFAKYCYEHGVHAMALITPWFYPYDDENLYQNFKAVAEAVPDMPIFIYNNPGRANNKLTVKLYKRLLNDFENIVGVKDSSKDMGLFQDYVNEAPKEAIAISGSDSLFYLSLCAGAKGIVTAISNSHPEIFVALWDAFRAGDLEKACEIQDEINRMRTIFKIGPYASGYKYAIEKRGLKFGGFRLPLRDLTEAEKEKFEKAYADAEFIRKWEQ